MKEIVIISGKGGTGKTSLTASLAAMASPVALADCDVDAADLHLLLAPETRQTEPFSGGHIAVINPEKCISCGVCLARCRFDAVLTNPDESSETRFSIDPLACEGCGVCVWNCPVKAIDFPEEQNGEWRVSTTRHGPMAHARLNPGGENSGKLVSKVRELARSEATAAGLDSILIDGPPGVGCAVIASLSGASLALAVTEPTVAGAHDLARILQLIRHFKIPSAVCVNKWDLNQEMTGRIEQEAREAGATPIGRLRYDKAATAAQMEGRSIVEASDSPLAQDIRELWKQLRKLMQTITEDLPHE